MTKKLLLILLASILTVGIFTLCACGSHEHTFSEKWNGNENYHWHDATCSDTTEKSGLAAHTFVGAKCSVCDYSLKTTDGLVYELNADGNSYALKSVGEVTDENVIVPSTYNGKPVTIIADKAFWLCSTVVKIVLPEGITEIGEYAFADCNNVKSIYIPEGVKSIGYMALMDCTSLPEITLPASLEEIGGSLVFYSRALKNLNFAGTKAQWEAISKDGWNNGVTVSVVHCSDGDVSAR